MGGPGSGKTSFVNHMKKDPILRANPIVIPMWHRGIGKCSICGIRNNDAFELPGYNRRVIVMETECVCGWVLKQTNPSWATIPEIPENKDLYTIQIWRPGNILGKKMPSDQRKVDFVVRAEKGKYYVSESENVLKKLPEPLRSVFTSSEQGVL